MIRLLTIFNVQKIIFQITFYLVVWQCVKNHDIVDKTKARACYAMCSEA